ncbi:MAG: HPr family phosphocarrier protein [Planctomycetota bacterium]|jgi:phosphocarrier protein|nr:HPr family phosphocarrier protein [Planctomycetota bacterium]
MAKERFAVDAEIVNKYGFHVRPSTQFMQKAKEFQSNVTVEANGVMADGKSIMQLMTLCAVRGTKIRITAIGPDAGQATEALAELIRKRFGGID